MTHSRKRALWALAVLAVVLVAFATAFFSSGGPEDFGRDRGRILIVAVVIGVGFLLHLLTPRLAGLRSAKGPVVRDERDEFVARRASGAAMTMTLIYVFVVSISLWEAYREDQVVPVGWMWFLAYTSMFFGALSHAVATLFLDATASGHDGA
jgi:Predicted membrane protein (DUF2178)